MSSPLASNSESEISSKRFSGGGRSNSRILSKGRASNSLPMKESKSRTGPPLDSSRRASAAFCWSEMLGPVAPTLGAGAPSAVPEREVLGDGPW